MKNHYKLTDDKYINESKYGPLQSNGIDYLCPECGGYGFIDDDRCSICNGSGIIALDDVRVFSKK
jgi:DnaJ-class molecular chaperone